MPLLPGVRTLSHYHPNTEEQNYHQLLNVMWRPQLAVIGMKGMQPLETAGNVTYKELTFRCSLRLPPTLKCTDAEKSLRKIIFSEKETGAFDPTFGA